MREKNEDREEERAGKKKREGRNAEENRARKMKKIVKENELGN